MQTALYEDVTRAGWFRGRPDKVRGVWKVAGLRPGHRRRLGRPGLLSHRLHWAPVGIAVTAASASRCSTSAAGCRRGPARGARCWPRRRGSASTSAPPRPSSCASRRAQDIFSRYLPFAVVFGETDRWVQVFGPLAAAVVAGQHDLLVRRADRLGPDALRCLDERLHLVGLEHLRGLDVVILRRIRILRRRLLGGRWRRRWRRLLVREPAGRSRSGHERALSPPRPILSWPG